MGTTIKVDPASIRPSQDFLKEDTLSFIQQKFAAGEFDALPPIPMVRKDSSNGLVAIDGHNLLAFYVMKEMKCDVYVADSPEDGLPGDSAMVQKRNSDLLEKYQSALEQADALKYEGLETIAALCERVGLKD